MTEVSGQKPRDAFSIRQEIKAVKKELKKTIESLKGSSTINSTKLVRKGFEKYGKELKVKQNQADCLQKLALKFGLTKLARIFVHRERRLLKKLDYLAKISAPVPEVEKGMTTLKEKASKLRELEQHLRQAEIASLLQVELKESKQLAPEVELALTRAPELEDDEEVVRFLVSQNPEVLQHASTQTQRREIKERPYLLKYASDEIKKDKQVVLEAVKERAYVLQFAHDDLKKDQEFIQELVKVNPKVRQYVGDDLKEEPEFNL